MRVLFRSVLQQHLDLDTVAAGAQFAHRLEYARRVQQARVEFATVDMQAAPRLADDGGRRGHRGVAAFDRLRAVDPAPHRLVLDPGFDEAFADRNEAVARIERLRGHMGVEDDDVPAQLARLPQQSVQQCIADTPAPPVPPPHPSDDATETASGKETTYK